MPEETKTRRKMFTPAELQRFQSYTEKHIEEARLDLSTREQMDLLQSLFTQRDKIEESLQATNAEDALAARPKPGKQPKQPKLAAAS